MNVSGTAGSFADRLVSSARSAINAAFLSVASTPVAQAIAPKPRVVSRAAWGADLASGGCPPRGPPEYGAVQRGCHPPHGERERLHARGGPLDRSRHLPLPRLRQRLERHRLQRARRPLRDALRGPRRRSQAAGGRRPGTGLQLPDDLDRLDRRPHQRGTHTAGAALDHPVPGLEDGDQPRLSGDRHRPADLGGRAGEPLPGGRGDHRPADRRPHHARPDCLPGRAR